MERETQREEGRWEVGKYFCLSVQKQACMKERNEREMFETLDFVCANMTVS